LGSDEVAEFQERGDSDARTGFGGQPPARVGIEHPRRDGDRPAVHQFHHVDFFSPRAKPPKNARLGIKTGMMPIADSLGP
jgi:hypothetical protein